MTVDPLAGVEVTHAAPPLGAALEAELGALRPIPTRRPLRGNASPPTTNPTAATVAIAAASGHRGSMRPRRGTTSTVSGTRKPSNHAAR